MEIQNLINVDFNYQTTETLLSLLLNPGKRAKLFEAYLSTNPDLSRDCFLEEFQSKHADRNKLKQDFTPSSVANIVAGITDNVDSVLDVCAGSGALTIAKWQASPNAQFYCEEFSKEALAFLLFNLAVRGINAEVRHCDVLTGKTFGGYKLTSNGKTSDIKEFTCDWVDLKVDCVISNPPYSASWEQKQHSRFDGYELAPKNKADYAFVLHGLSYLKEGAKACFVLPHGVLFRGQAEEKIRRQLLNNNLVHSVIGLPNNLFLSTSIPVCLLVLQKNKTDNDCLVIEASDLCVKKKATNEMTDEHIQRVLSVYNNRQTVDKLATLASLQDIEVHDFNLNIPRYVDTHEPEEAIDLLKTAKELLEITKEMEQNGLAFVQMLNELQMPNGTQQQKEEFEQAKRIIAEVFAPKPKEIEVVNAIIENKETFETFPVLTDEEWSKLNGFIQSAQRKLELLKDVKQYFLSKMFA